jgi:hypothetical protein
MRSVSVDVMRVSVFTLHICGPAVVAVGQLVSERSISLLFIDELYVANWKNGGYFDRVLFFLQETFPLDRSIDLSILFIC